MFDQTKYDKTLSYDLNMRRREEVNRGFYEKVVQQDRIDAHKNQMLTKRIAPAEVRMSMEELRMRILYDESLKRRKIRQLYDVEKLEYDKLCAQSAQREASQDVQCARLEAKAQEIRAQKMEQTSRFNKSAYARQWEQNCDELRGVDAQIQARACRLQWQLQDIQKQKIREYEEERERRIDSITVTDYKKFLVDQQEAQKERIKLMEKTRRELDEQLNDQQRRRAYEREQELLREDHEKQLRDFGAEIERMAQDIQLQKNYFNKAELECQMAVEQATKQAHRQVEIFDGQALIKQIREEQKQQALLKYENMLREHELELAYTAVEEQRRQVIANEEKALNTYFLDNIKSRDKQLQIKEERDLAKRKQLDMDCYTSNQQFDESKRQMQAQNKEDKRAELEAAYADIELMRKEKAEALQQKMREQREYLAYLYMQDGVKKEKAQSIRLDDAEYAKSQKVALLKDLEEIQTRLGDQNERIKELDSIRLVDNKRPKLQQRHWYNV